MRADVLLSMVLLGLLLGRGAEATTIEFEAGGVVLSPPGLVLPDLSTGDPYVLTFSLDSSTADINPDPDVGVYQGVVFSLRVGSYATTGTARLEIVNDGPAFLGGDTIQLFADLPASGAPDLFWPGVGDFEPEQFLLLRLFDQSRSTLSDDDLDVFLIGDGVFPRQQFQLTYCLTGTNCNRLALSGDLTTIVPEPSTGALLSLGLGALAMRQRWIQ